MCRQMNWACAFADVPGPLYVRPPVAQKLHLPGGFAAARQARLVHNKGSSVEGPGRDVYKCTL